MIFVANAGYKSPSGSPPQRRRLNCDCLPRPSPQASPRAGGVCESASRRGLSVPEECIMAHQQFCYDFPRPALTADAIVLTREPSPRVLLIRRKHPPFIGAWALPGGFVDQDEPVEDAVRRELREETGLDIEIWEQIQTFGDPGRDPRGWTVSVAFVARVAAAGLTPQA